MGRPHFRRLFALLSLVATLAMASCQNLAEESESAPSGGTSASVEVVTAHASFDPPRSIEEMADRSTAAVVATAGEKSQWAFNEGTDAEVVSTRQLFELESVLWGEVGEEFVVHFPGGLQERAGGETYMLEFPETPQYEQGATYLLVLWKRSVGDDYVPTGTQVDEYVAEGFNVVGPGTGRYKVVDGVLRGASADVAGQGRSEDGHPNSVGFNELIGRPVEEARGRLMQARDDLGRG